MVISAIEHNETGERHREYDGKLFLIGWLEKPPKKIL